jgi:hypothetical protein
MDTDQAIADFQSTKRAVEWLAANTNAIYTYLRHAEMGLAKLQSAVPDNPESQAKLYSLSHRIYAVNEGLLSHSLGGTLIECQRELELVWKAISD